MKPIYTLSISLILLTSAFTAQAQGVRGDLLARINDLRASRGLAPYTLNSALNAAAGNHAQWMTATSNISHIQEDGSRPSDRARTAGYDSTFVSENIYMGPRAGAGDAWTFWVNSAIHYAGLTSSNYQHVGIGTASGPGGNAYVLVFGSPGGVPRVVSNSSSNSNANAAEAAAPAAPSFVVGWDQYGNIMHQVQPGDTLGDIALIYGYTWDDIPTMLALNEMTDNDIRGLEIGSVLLVPSQSGTYTPAPQPTATMTPLPTDEPEATEAIANAESEATEEAQPTSTPDATSTDEPLTVAQPAATLVPPVAYVAPTTTPTIMPTLVMLARPVGPTSVALLPSVSAPLVLESNPAPASRPPLWLMGIIVVQVAVLGLAGAEFLRRLLK